MEHQPSITFLGVKGPPRITFMNTGLGYGGAETQLIQLAVRLKDRGWEPQIVLMIQPQGLVELLDNANIPWVTLNMRRGVPDPRAILKLAHLLRDWNPLIFHSHQVKSNILARVTRIFVDVPVQISTAHSINEGARWRELAYRVTDPLCDLTTNVSAAATARYIAVKVAPKNKLRTIPNGVDIEKFRPDNKLREEGRRQLGCGGKFVWLAVGRFDPAKDYPTMLKAYSQICSQFPDTVLIVAGQGPTVDKCQQLAYELGIATKLLFLGIRNDIPMLMNAADAYVMSSAWEGFPMVLLEASATGLPIVATDVGGNREIVRDRQSGLLVQPRRPTEMASAMKEIMGLSVDKRKEMGAAGRAYIKMNFSFEHVVNIWEQVYLHLLASRARESRLYGSS